MKKQYLPLSVYNAWISAALFQSVVNIVVAIQNLPENRLSHLMFVLLHLGMACFWAWQKKKARNYVPPASIKTADKEFTATQAKLFLGIAIGFFILVEVYMLYMNWDYFQMNRRYGVPTTFSNILTQLSLHVMSLPMGYTLIAVAKRALRDARAATLKPQTVAPTEATTESRPTWWTQDETRQEIKRR
jgi:hypothetical protein